MAKRGLLTRPRTITGKKTTPKGLKPQQARQLIRRFHVLQKNKTRIISKINQQWPHKSTPEGPEGPMNLDESNYKSVILEKFSGIYPHKDFRLNDQKKNLETILKLDQKISLQDLVKELAKIDAEIEYRGGLKAYQSASTQGQNNNRGGDSSKKLIEWITAHAPYEKFLKNNKSEPLNALEIGCLDPNNVISTCGIFQSVAKIDLNSQSPHILEQDFMKRPLPENYQQRFNLISCSLVLNFVPTPKERGEMLLRITQFLKPPTKKKPSMSSFFFVLPLPCLQNSRYMDLDRFESMMSDLGFSKVFRHESSKIVYYLFDWSGKVKQVKYPKKELHSGGSRNNFCIVIE
ncbi:25S rRNA (adenine(2142)-N(1))-methyltransferase [[Candida] anglica]|uniref:25S rRNA adenine-N(1) methyltransferase n=1 Tax=[Candida] anglica TaxID=148631 RepID=A0ABP0EDW2_9ASCO